MTPDGAFCEACGATLAPGSPTCRVCGRDNTKHLARLGIGDRAAGATDEPQAGPAARAPRSKESGITSVTTFHPATRVPAPLRSAPASKRFEPVAGRVIRDRPKPSSEPAMDEEGVMVLEHQKDLTPTWIYGTILAVCVVGFFFSFVWWASSSDIMTTFWRLAFLILMGVFALVGIVVSVRVSRKEDLTTKAKVVAARKAQGARRYASRRARGAKQYARRRKEGMVDLVHQTRSSVKHTGESLRASGTHFREGFHGESDPNFLVKMLRGVIRFVVWVYVKLERLVLFVFRLLVGVFRLVYWIYVLVVRVAWALYRGIAQPVLFFAYKVARWVVGAAYYTARGTLRLAWRIVYWVVRRWPIVYATQALEAPVRVHVVPPLYATDVFVSEFLRVKARPVVVETAKPTVEARRLVFRTKRAERLLEVQEEREEEFAARAVVVPPEERWRRWRQGRREKRQELKAQREAAKQAKLDEKAAERARKEAKKEAETEFKNRLKAAKKEGKKLSKEEKEELELEVLKKHLGEEALEELRPKKEKPREEKAPKAEKAEQAPDDPAAEKEEEKERKRRHKEEAQLAKKQKAEERKQLKAEKKARKQAEKEGKKPSKQEAKALEEEIIEDLVAKTLGREPRQKEASATAGSKEESPAKPGEEAGQGEDKDLPRKERKRLEREEKERAKEEEKRAKEEEKKRKQEEKKRQQEEKQQAKKEKGKKKGKGEDEGDEEKREAVEGGGAA